ncbi:hypothetical protein PMAYCL1PPCAC_01000, partial [Pristionchus mayeri]
SHLHRLPVDATNQSESYEKKDYLDEKYHGGSQQHASETARETEHARQRKSPLLHLCVDIESG